MVIVVLITNTFKFKYINRKYVKWITIHIGAQPISVLIFIGAAACAARKVYIFKLKCGVECKHKH